MTRDEKPVFIDGLEDETLSPKQLSILFGGNSYQYNITARNGTLPFPHIWRGRNLRILKEPVREFLANPQITKM